MSTPLQQVAELARAPRWLHAADACCETTLDARGFVLRCYATFSGRARARGVTLSTEVSGALPTFAGCAVAVTNVLHRAVARALDHAQPGSLVVVAAVAHRHGVAFEVGAQEPERAGLWRTKRRNVPLRWRLAFAPAR